MRRFLCLVAACLLLCGQNAWAHRIDEYLQATIVSLSAHRVDASMRMIPGVMVAPKVITAIDSNGDGIFADAEKRGYAQRVLLNLSLLSDGRAVAPVLDGYVFPDAASMRAGLGEITIRYHADLPAGNGVRRSFVLQNHPRIAGSVYLMNAEVPLDAALQIFGQVRDPSQSMYEVNYTDGHAATGSFVELRAWWSGVPFASLFRLGMRHIAEGTDHLLFLLVLLLPAPLLAVGDRWSETATVRASVLHLLGIVTAFTIGHSLTLTLGALGFVRVSGRPVEVLIAVSILVSAVHALRPIFPGREAWIAASFGLIHGLAFAATLDRLGLERWERVAGIFAFNLGIEAMQMAVVAVVLPLLLVASRTRGYVMLRVSGALAAMLAATVWIAQRSQ